MGLKANEAIEVDFEGFLAYLRSKTRVFMDVDGEEYYITHTDGYWRVQDCSKLNDKGRFTDCTELVTTMPELVELPWHDGAKRLRRVRAHMYAVQSPGLRVRRFFVCPS